MPNITTNHAITYTSRISDQKHAPFLGTLFKEMKAKKK